MKIYPIITHNDLQNIFYILEYGNKKALVIDPCDSKLCQDFLDKNKLSLEKILITHEHHDHYSGVEVLDCSEVYAGQITAENIPVEVTHVFADNEIIFEYENIILKAIFAPGHAAGHMMFEVYEDDTITAIFVGDVLFAGGVGNTYSGDSRVLYESIQLFKKYSDDVIVYSGHDYLENNFSFIEKYFPEKKESLDEILRKKGRDVYFTHLGEERKINPFLSCDKKGFIELRTLRNTW